MLDEQHNMRIIINDESVNARSSDDADDDDDDDAHLHV